VKFIVDAQLPKVLSELLKYRGYDSLHTLDLENRNATSDTVITKLALEQSRIVITKDSDFIESFLLKSEPRKLIIVRTGNIPNKLLLKIFDDNLDLIKELLAAKPFIQLLEKELSPKA
jgi:predicted nuclease of predicted toxin-antitoxin system